MGEKLKEFFGGLHPVDKAIRPMAVLPDEKHILFQISFFHGFFKYRLPDFEDENDKGEIVQVWKLPIPQKVRELHSWEYQLNSAHHGIAVNKRRDHKSPTGFSAMDSSRACVAMTMSGYAAIVDLDHKDKQWLFPLVWDKNFDPKSDNPAKGFTHEAVQNNPTAAKPYWSTETEDGTRCLVSVSQGDKVFVINFGDKNTDPFVEAILSVGENTEGKRTKVVGSEPYQIPSLKFVKHTGGEKMAKPIFMPNIKPLTRLSVKRNQRVQNGAIYKKGSYSLNNLPYMMKPEQREKIKIQNLSHPQRVRNGAIDIDHILD
jgi:hypothetical protein